MVVGGKYGARHQTWRFFLPSHHDSQVFESSGICSCPDFFFFLNTSTASVLISQFDRPILITADLLKGRG